MEARNKLFIFGGILALVCLGIFYNFVPLEREVILAGFVVGETMGFDLSPGKLNFGMIVPGNGATRNLFIENEFDEEIRVVISYSGNIVGSLSVSENDFVLFPGEVRNISFSVYVEEGFEMGDYFGEVVVVSKKG